MDPQQTRLRDVPILLVDIAGFTSEHRGVERQRVLLEHLQEVLTRCARFFLPFGNVWAKWKRHGTGDGYYFLLDGQPAQVALRYALDLAEALRTANETHPELQIRLRMVLSFGDVEWVGDQILSEAMAVAERVISYSPFKERSDASDPGGLAVTDLFFVHLRRELAKQVHFEQLPGLEWSPFELTDKHGFLHRAYVLGEALAPLPPKAASEPPAPLRVTILIGHGIGSPLPEAVEMARVASSEFANSGLGIEVRLDQASLTSLARAARAGCDLLIYYGHGDTDGNLWFVDGRRNFEQLAGGELETLWKGLAACFVFACYGERFALQLPCPWVAFSEPILNHAPKGFLHAFVGELTGRDLGAAVERARDRCTEEMASDFAAVMRFSDPRPPPLQPPAGPAVLRRTSPGISGNVVLGFGSVADGDLRYPEHDPFVGRVAILDRLLRVPAPGDDGPFRRRIWVHGEPGMGKTALLRQTAAMVRDLAFRDAGEEVYLLHLNCYRYSRARDVAVALCERARTLYGLAESPASLDELTRRLAAFGTSRTHVWILDDLTYLSPSSDRSEEVAALTDELAAGLEAHALRAQLVLSSRRPPPQRGFEPIEVGPLSEAEALRLAFVVAHRRWGTEETSDEADLLLGARRIFGVVRGLTALYKQSLLLASMREMSLTGFADSLDESGLDALDLAELSQRMMASQVEHLGAMEDGDGFRYRRFLATYYALIKRCSSFTAPELGTWFGDAFRTAADRRDVSLIYRNGLTRLVRLGMVAVEDRGGTTVFTLPPNQRWPIRALAAEDAALPPAVPLRGARERLSLALERAALGDFGSVADLLEMERDYQTDLADPSALSAVLFGKLVRSEMIPDPARSVAVLDEGIALYRSNAASLAPEELEPHRAGAAALFNKGVTLGQLGQSEQAVAVYDEVVTRFGERSEATLLEPVAQALVNKGLALGQLDQSEQAVAVYGEVVTRFGERSERTLLEPVAQALVCRGVTLGRLGQSEQALADYDEVVARFGERSEPAFAEQVAQALFNKGVRLAQLGQSEQAMTVYDEVMARFGERSEPALTERAAQALFKKGVTLGQLGQSEQAVVVYDELVARFGERSEPALAEQVAQALVNKG